MVPKLSRNEHSKPDSLSKIPRVFNESKKVGSSTLTKPILKNNGMESFREKLSSERISGRASDLISKARRIGINSNYESTWRKLDSWCREKQVDPIRYDIILILDFI